MLPEPPALPHKLLSFCCELESRCATRANLRDCRLVIACVGDVWVPLAPLAGGPSEWMGRDMEEMANLLVLGPLSEPVFDFGWDESGNRPFKR
jgi:hypothetical protein